ncbi:heme biosynthesis protein HemY [Pedococcus sp. NPDC057267]|uniref:heme biosynthesis protein HemY n=1 Tax=Pedococcus sp. NPDC057267 TaxID=3346077 RepID=UPI003641342D
MGKRTRTPAPAPRRRELPDFTTLPDRVPPEALVTTQAASDAPDPEGGRDTETEFLLRNAAL